MNKSWINRYWMIMVREMRLMARRPLYILMLVVMPAFMATFFLSMMSSGTPKEMPLAVVDKDNSSTSRNLVRTLGSMKNGKIAVRTCDFKEARALMQAGEVYGIYYIPEKFESDLQAYRQPTISYYTNNAYMIPGSLLMTELKTMGALGKIAVSQSTMRAKGQSEDMLMGIVQPISVETYSIGNPSGNYMTYMCNTIITGLIDIIVMLFAVYVLGKEVKDGTSLTLMRIAGDNTLLAVAAKETPLLIISTCIYFAIDVVMYKYIGLPMKCGIATWLLLQVVYLISTISLAIFIYGLMPVMRMSLSVVSIWSVLSVSMSGLTFPVSAMPPILQAWSNLFPLKHLHAVYMDMGLNGYGMHYSWTSIAAMMLFCLPQLLIIGGGGIRKQFTEMKYKS